MGSEYSLVYMNMSNCAWILDMPESAEIYLNMGKHSSVPNTLLRLKGFNWNVSIFERRQ